MRRDICKFRGVVPFVLALVMVGVLAWTPLSAAAAVGRTVTAPAGAAADPKAALTSIACMSSNCFAIGSYMDAAGHNQSMFTVNGRRATTIALPADAAADPSALIDSIGCTSHRCIAVGEYDSEPGASQPVISVNGHRATKVTLPPDAPASSEGGLTSIACNARSCLAFGHYSGASEEEMMVSTNGRAAQTVTLPADVGERGESSLFRSVACSSKACIAVGSYVDTSGATQPLVSINGRAATKVKLPAGATFGELTAVGCSSQKCVAVGSYCTAPIRSGGCGGGAMISVGGGPASTNIPAPPVPAGSSLGELDSVACGAPGCIVFGSFYNPAFVGGPQNNAPIAQGMADVPGHPATQIAFPTNLSPQALNQWLDLSGAACNKHTCIAAGATGSTVMFSEADVSVNDLALVSVNRQAATAVTPPAGAPSVVREDQLSGAACSLRRCMAVGDYWDQTQGGQIHSNTQAMLWAGR